MKRRTLLFWLLLTASLAAGQDPADAAHFSYDKHLPLDVREIKVENRDGVEVHDISYSSPKGGRVPAYLVVPPGHGPFAAVIYAHWCMPGSPQKNRTEFLPEALALARAGAVSLLLDHVSVRPGFVEDSSPLNEQQIDVMVQQVIDIQRGADLLLARKDVDLKRLAYAGHSCDATAGGILSGVDKRFKAVIIMAGELSDQVDLATKRYREYRQKIGPEKFDAFAAKYAWADPGKYVSHAAPAFVFMQFADQEPYLTPEIAAQYYGVASVPKKLTIYHAEHALNSDATRDRVLFLTEQLSLQPLDPKIVDGIPPLWQPPWK
jgi:dienelactone hydrolase